MSHHPSARGLVSATLASPVLALLLGTACGPTPTTPTTTTQITDSLVYALEIQVDGSRDRGNVVLFDDYYEVEESPDPLANTLAGQSAKGARGTGSSAVEPGEITLGADMTSGGEDEVVVYVDSRAAFFRTSCGYAPGTPFTATLTLAPAQAATPTGGYATSRGDAFLAIEVLMDVRAGVASRWVESGVTEGHIGDDTGYAMTWRPVNVLAADSDGLNPFDGYVGLDMTSTTPELTVDAAGCIELEVRMHVEGGLAIDRPGSIGMAGAYSLSVFIET